MSVVAEIKRWIVHAGGQDHRGWLPKGAAIPLPLPKRDVILDLRIEKCSGGFLLVMQLTDDSPDFPETSLRESDSWHQTVDDAKNQAELEFGVPTKFWKC